MDLSGGQLYGTPPSTQNHQNTHQYESIVAAFICFIASLTRLKHLSETRICTCLHMSTTCLSHHDLSCGDESSQEYLSWH